MKKLILTIALIALSPIAWCDFSCPIGTEAACMEQDDKICPSSARCVATASVCFEEYACDADDGYVCASRYDEATEENTELVGKYNEMTSKHNDLLNKTSGKERCVIMSETLEEAKRCISPARRS